MAKRTKKKQKRSPEVEPITETQASGTALVDFIATPWKQLLQALVIVAATWWIYWPVLHGDWLWDDDHLITQNLLVHDSAGLWKIWFEPGSLLDYQPIKFTVVWIQWHLWGNDTFGYHATNVILHIINALLVWRLLSKFGLRLAWLGGLIFAIHPAQVESVAWIAELKNTLSLPPFLLAMCSWIDYEEQKQKRCYFLALGLFLVAMLCKTTMVMFPVVILLYAWWKRDRIRWHDLKLSVPFFVLSLGLGLITVWFLQQHAIGNAVIPLGGFFSRLALAGLSTSFYFSKCFLPVELLPIYPHWPINPPSLRQFLPWPVLGGMTWWLWTKRQSLGRHALLGLGFFLINLLPFMGFTEGSYMRFTWVMDHILYLPIIGLIGLVIAGLGQLFDRVSASTRLYGIGVVAVMMALLAWESRWYAGMFSNSETLWTYTLKHNPEAWLAHYNLGNRLVQKNQISEAIEQFKQALRINPDYAEAHNNLGNVFLQTGRTSEAMELYVQALQIKPDYVEAHNNLGVILKRTGRISEAIDQFEAALRINPDYAEAHYNLGNALFHTNRISEAIYQYEQVLRINPDDAETHNILGNALFQTSQTSEAIDQYEQALRIKPDDVEVHYNLGNALLQTGRMTEAIDQYEQALRIKPDFAEAHCNLGNALFQTGRTAEAIDQYEETLRIKPDFAQARNNLTQLQALEKTAPVKK